MKKLLLALSVLISVTFSFSGLAFATSTQKARDEVCSGISTSVGGGCGQGATDIQNIIEIVLQILSWIAGIAAVIMIVIAGLRYITSGGDSSGVASAKQSLIYAIVGIIVVALAQGIVIFVTGRASGQ